jgi:hypothetical protein
MQITSPVAECEFVYWRARGRVRQCGKLHASDYTHGARANQSSAKSTRAASVWHITRKTRYIIARPVWDRIVEARFPHKLSFSLRLVESNVAGDLSAHQYTLFFPPHAQHSNYLYSTKMQKKNEEEYLFKYWTSNYAAKGDLLLDWLSESVVF